MTILTSQLVIFSLVRHFLRFFILDSDLKLVHLVEIKLLRSNMQDM